MNVKALQALVQGAAKNEEKASLLQDRAMKSKLQILMYAHVSGLSPDQIQEAIDAGVEEAHR